MSVTVQLSTPIQTHKGLINSLTINEPSAKLFFDYGEPVKVMITKLPNDEQKVDLDYKYPVMKKWIVDLSPELDDISIESLSVDDFYSVRNALTEILFKETGKNP